jgi:hypothetical protein
MLNAAAAAIHDHYLRLDPPEVDPPEVDPFGWVLLTLSALTVLFIIAVIFRKYGRHTV